MTHTPLSVTVHVLCSCDAPACSDLALIEDPRFRRYVEAYAADEKVFFRDFAAAFQKLMELGVDFNKKKQVNLQK